MIFFGDEIMVLKYRFNCCWNVVFSSYCDYAMSRHIERMNTCGLSTVNETGRLELGDDGEIKKRC